MDTGRSSGSSIALRLPPSRPLRGSGLLAVFVRFYSGGTAAEFPRRFVSGCETKRNSGGHGTSLIACMFICKPNSIAIDEKVNIYFYRTFSR